MFGDEETLEMAKRVANVKSVVQLWNIFLNRSFEMAMMNKICSILRSIWKARAKR